MRRIRQDMFKVLYRKISSIIRTTWDHY